MHSPRCFLTQNLSGAPESETAHASACFRPYRSFPDWRYSFTHSLRGLFNPFHLPFFLPLHSASRFSATTSTHPRSNHPLCSLALKVLRQFWSTAVPQDRPSLCHHCLFGDGSYDGPSVQARQDRADRLSCRRLRGRANLLRVRNFDFPAWHCADVPIERTA